MKGFYICLLLILNTGLGISQIHFSGSVVDENGHPIANAHIILLKNQRGTSSNLKGIFSFHIDSPDYRLDSVKVSCLGHETVLFPISLYGRVSRDFVLKENALQLSETLVTDIRSVSYSAEYIVKKSQKQLKKNYVNRKIIQEGFYRELLRENGIALKVNECAFNLVYNAYPKGSYSKSSFRQFYTDYREVSRFKPQYALSGFAQFWPIYITPHDRVNVTSSRVSSNTGAKDGSISIIGDPLGGPIDLVAMDNVKYKLNCFNPKLFKKYRFSLKEVKMVDDRACYVISYTPKDTAVSYHHNYSRKIACPIYSGEIVITKDSFVVVGFTSESILWKRWINYGNYIDFLYPNSIKYEVQYQHTHEGWGVKRIAYSGNYNPISKNN